MHLLPCNCVRDIDSSVTQYEACFSTECGSGLARFVLIFVEKPCINRLLCGKEKVVKIKNDISGQLQVASYSVKYRHTMALLSSFGVQPTLEPLLREIVSG